MINPLQCLILRFLLLLRPAKDSLFDLIARTRAHGRTCLKNAYALRSDERKKAKRGLDIKFLLTCKTFDVFPKFLRFKLCKKSLKNSKRYKSWQNDLPEHEINFKKRRLHELEKSRNTQEGANFRSQLTAHLQRFSDHVEKVMQREISCQPIWQAFRVAASVTCQQLLGSVSAYWLASLLTGCLLLLLAPAALALLTRLAGDRTDHSRDCSAEDDEKLWRSPSSEIHERVKANGESQASERTADTGRW